MQKPSKERVSSIARLLVDALERVESVHLIKDREAVRQSIVHSLIDELRHDEERQAAVLQRLGNNPELVPGSKDWENAVRRLLEEEYERVGFDGA